MINRHLTEDELQAYLDGGASSDFTYARDHLSTCAYCQDELASYRQLFRELKNRSEAGLSDGFPERVLAQIPVEGGRKWLSNYAESLPIFIGILLGAVLIIRSFDLWSFANFPISNLFDIFSPQRALGFIDSFVGIFNYDLHLVPLLGLIIIPIIAFDRFISGIKCN